jgi:hypothetical protein
VSSPLQIQSVCIASYENSVASVRLDWRNGHFELSWLALGEKNAEPLETKDWLEARTLYDELVTAAQQFRAPLRLVQGGAS